MPRGPCPTSSVPTRSWSRSTRITRYSAVVAAIRDNDLEVLGGERRRVRRGAGERDARRPVGPATAASRSPDGALGHRRRDRAGRRAPATPAAGSGRTTSTSPTGSAGTSASSGPAARGTPGRTLPELVELRSTVRPAAPAYLPAAAATSRGGDRPTSSSSTPVSRRRVGGRPAHDAARSLRGAHAVASTCSRSAASTTRTSPTTTSAAGWTSRPGTARSSAASSASCAPMPASTTRRAEQLRRRRRRLGHGGDRAGPAPIPQARRAHRHRRDGVRHATPTTTHHRPWPTAIGRLLRRSRRRRIGRQRRDLRPCFPAALPGVVGVGALDSDGRSVVLQLRPVGRRLRRRASTSSARSSATSTTAADDGADHRSSTAAGRRWSGTSFAAPKVAGVIAQRDVPPRARPRRRRGTAARHAPLPTARPRRRLQRVRSYADPVAAPRRWGR